MLSHGCLLALRHRTVCGRPSIVRYASNASREGAASHLSKPARTRFAPSPTGYLHLGSLRTALFTYLLARKTGGQFVLRIEDTDESRTVPGAEDRLCDDLRWAGLHWDEGPGIESKYGPFRQSERTQHYQKFANELVQSGHAYRCFCTAQRLDQLARLRKELGLPTDYDRQCAGIPQDQSDERAANGEAYVVRFRVPMEYPPFADLVYGKVGKDKGSHTGITVKHGEIAYEDPVLLKSDGRPTYHLANVVDDHLMDITHVLRATEWMPSTPKHLALYQAFGWAPPSYAHVGLLVNESGQKLSKRHLHTDIQHYRDEGYLASALLNFVALMGWSHGHRSDVMDLAELVEQFQMKFTRGNAVVKLDKLNYLQRAHAVRAAKSDDAQQRTEMVERMCDAVRADLHVDQAPNGASLEPYVGELLKQDAANYTTPKAFIARSIHFFKDPSLTTAPATDGSISPAELHEAAVHIFEHCSTVGKWSTDSINDAIKAQAKTLAKTKDAQEEKAVYRALCKYIRWFLLGGHEGPSLAHAMIILGKDICTRRLDAATAAASLAP